MMVAGTSKYLLKAVRDEIFDFLGRQLSGQQEPGPRWIEALLDAGGQERPLADAMSKAYVERHVAKDARPVAGEILAAIVRPPAFDPRADPAVNCGAMGAIIGHEISHLFDDKGRASDGDGLLRDWWTPQDGERFTKVAPGRPGRRPRRAGADRRRLAARPARPADRRSRRGDLRVGGRALEGRFRTFAEGPFSFRVLFASCAATGSTSPVFTAMREQQADLFVHMGDLHYEDIARNAVFRFREAYLAVHASAAQSALFRSLPLAYTWDDHDFGPNDPDRTSPSRGDAHMLAMDDGTHSQYSTLPQAPARGFVVAHAAPMDRRPTKKGGPYTCPEVAQNGQYGVMDVHDDGARVRVRLQGMRGSLEVPGMRLELAWQTDPWRRA